MLLAVVPATFHVMVLVSPIYQTGSLVFGLLLGAVITKGPVLATVIAKGCVYTTRAPNALLSLTIATKLYPLATVDNVSHSLLTIPLFSVVPANTVCTLENDL